MTELHRQTIPLEQLSVGMFVVDLDISWVNSPFLTHSRKIRSFKDIDALRRSGVKNLVIDLQRGSRPKTTSAESVREQEAQSQESQESVAQIAPQVASRPNAAAEMAAAKELSKNIKSLANRLFEAIETNEKIDADAVAPLVEGTIQSLTRNNQALLSLVHLSRKSQKLVDHAFSTFCMALNIALCLRKSPEDLQALGMAALLHEMGWQQLPLNLMGKRTRYAPHEVELVKKHVVIGVAMLGKSGLPALVERLIAEHHERADGSGYPRGLAAENLHPLSAILAVADNYDERIHQLMDRPGMLPRVALQAMYKEAQAGALDADVMTAFIATLGVYPVTSAVLLHSGEKAIVIDVDQGAHCSTVCIVYGADGKALKTPEEVVIPCDASPERTIKSLLDPSDSRIDPFGLLVFTG